MSVPRFSVLDLTPIPLGSTPADALRNTLDLAQHAERLGYHRFWLAEYHSTPGLAGSATAVVIGYVAGGTRTIRVGAGGIMLPNHPPIMVAEAFGTLESLYPGRIDLGLGRSLGADPHTMLALRRDQSSGDRFPQDVTELQAFLAPMQQGQHVLAVPGAGLQVPLWILGSSPFGANLAARLGLPFAFASHVMPDAMLQALDVYHDNFKPSAQLDRPHTMAGANVFAADTDDEARRLFTSIQQQFVNLVRGTQGPLPPPLDDIDDYWSPIEKAQALGRFGMSFVGSRATVERGLSDFLRNFAVDEVIVSSVIYDHSARRRSYEILADIIARSFSQD